MEQSSKSDLSTIYLSKKVWQIRGRTINILILRKLGQDIRDARLRHRISTEIMAERASISRMTLYNAEKGDVNVSMGTYVTILFVLGMLERVSNLADAGEDLLGRQLDEERLPKRIRLPGKRTTAPGPAGMVDKPGAASAIEHTDVQKSLAGKTIAVPKAARKSKRTKQVNFTD